MAGYGYGYGYGLFARRGPFAAAGPAELLNDVAGNPLNDVAGDALREAA